MPSADRWAELSMAPRGWVIRGLPLFVDLTKEADIRLVTAGGGNACVHVHIVIHCQVVKVFRGHSDILLANERVNKPVDIGAIVIVLLDNQAGRVNPVSQVGMSLTS